MSALRLSEAQAAAHGLTPSPASRRASALSRQRKAARIAARLRLAEAAGPVTFFIHQQLPGMNEIIAGAKQRDLRRGRGSYAEMKRQAAMDVAMAAIRARVPRFERVSLDFLWGEPNRKRDPDNVAAGRKVVLDALVECGVLPGDGWKVVAGWTDSFVVTASAFVRVTITPVTAGGGW